ncbi:biotin/lipoate A/B protein ligase family protein [Trichocoleus sp. DQ-U1]|uniref:lipoate--protein ligase family protein n=1 Tax=Trichocoleus sp. DQ-U1 TaxID=2933926 RepID=UPI003299BFE9
MTNNRYWRLIPLLEASGRVQMAIDRWLLEQHHLGLHPPALRFYTWSPLAISLGYHQHRLPASWQQLAAAGVVDLVRRPTGGRGVLHQGDLTYMVVTSGLAGSRLQAYQEICEFLIQGWRSLGLELHYGSAGRGYIHNPNCFGTSTGADLVLADGSKLIGSAQMRRGNTILQHGSIRLSPDATLFEQVFGEAVTPVKLANKQQGEALILTVVEALTVAAKDCFGVEMLVQPFSESEWQEILAQPELAIPSPNKVSENPALQNQDGQC